MTTKYDELLARLDSEKDKRAATWFAEAQDAAAAIRDLQAQIEFLQGTISGILERSVERVTAAESRLHEVEAATIERCQKIVRQNNHMFATVEATECLAQAMISKATETLA